jgi:hypothetical protein
MTPDVALVSYNLFEDASGGCMAQWPGHTVAFSEGRPAWGKSTQDALVDVLEKSLPLHPAHSWAWYDPACLDALERSVEGAFRHLNKFVDCGFRILDRLLNDEDFESIRADALETGDSKNREVDCRATGR